MSFGCWLVRTNQRYAGDDAHDCSEAMWLTLMRGPFPFPCEAGMMGLFRALSVVHSVVLWIIHGSILRNASHQVKHLSIMNPQLTGKMSVIETNLLTQGGKLPILKFFLRFLPILARWVRWMLLGRVEVQEKLQDGQFSNLGCDGGGKNIQTSYVGRL